MRRGKIVPVKRFVPLLDWLPRFHVDHLIYHPRQPGMSLRQVVDEMEAIAKGVLSAIKTLR